MLRGGEGLTKEPQGSHGWVHVQRRGFSAGAALLGFSMCGVRLICSPPHPGLRTAFRSDSSLASHQPSEVPVGPRVDGSPWRSSPPCEEQGSGGQLCSGTAALQAP